MSKQILVEPEPVPEIRYFDICACGSYWCDSKDVLITGAKQVMCRACERLWDVSEAFIKKHLTPGRVVAAK